MAVALAEVAEVGAEGAEAGGEEEGLQQDSQSNAVSKGVQVAQIVSAGISVASSIVGLVATINTGKDETADIVAKRYAAGLLKPGESRQKLLLSHTISSYWSSYNIKQLINQGKTPFGWSPETCVGQGFGAEVSAWMLRKHASTVAARRDQVVKRHLQGLQIKNVADTVNAKAKNLAVIKQMRSSVLQ